MRAVVISGFGGEEVLELRDVPRPVPEAGQARVRVRAAGVNRADILQRLGLYRAPADAPQDIPGLEIAGEVEAIGAGVVDVAVGDRVYAVVSGGAYAEEIVVHARTLAKMPPGLDFETAAAIPEAFVTAYDAMVIQAGLGAGDTVLVSAVGSGVGTAAVQIARAIGARSIGTARTPDKLERAKTLGLDVGLVPREGPGFADEVRAATGGAGVDVVLELVGGAYVPESLASLAAHGRVVVVGLMAGTRAEIDLAKLLHQRLHVIGTVLRARPLEEKILATKLLAHSLTPLFASGALRAVVDQVLPLEKAGEAHRRMTSNEGFGKIVLRC